MPKTLSVSMTTFLDYIAASGPTRIGVVRKAVRNAATPYNPGADYWRQFREAVKALHRDGDEIAGLTSLLSRVAPSRANNYRRYALAYRKWLGRKQLEWFTPERRTWEWADLTVSVNPELGLSINGRPHIIKLYLRSDRITKRHVDAALEMLAQSYRDEIAQGTVVGILDVANAKLIKCGPPNDDLMLLLQGDALSFASIWRWLSEDAAA